MAGTATITIGEKSWECSLAQSVTELTTGLSGVASIPANTGVLFDMGNEYSGIDIYTDEMLFNIDIVYISADGTVVSVSLDVAPEDEESFEAEEGGAGARYFMEVNAGEAESVEIGDIVTISTSVGFMDTIYMVIPAIVVIGMLGMAIRTIK